MIGQPYTFWRGSYLERKIPSYPLTVEPRITYFMVILLSHYFFALIDQGVSVIL